MKHQLDTMGYQNGNQTMTDEGSYIKNIHTTCSKGGVGKSLLESSVLTRQCMLKKKRTVHKQYTLVGKYYFFRNVKDPDWLKQS